MKTKPGTLCTPINYNNLSVFTLGASLPVSAVNDKGETVVISQEPDGTGSRCFRLDTYQKNDWVRTNRFYANGVITEEYER